MTVGWMGHPSVDASMRNPRSENPDLVHPRGRVRGRVLEDPEAAEQQQDGDHGHRHVGKIFGFGSDAAGLGRSGGVKRDRQGGADGFGGGGHRGPAFVEFGEARTLV